MKNPLALCMLLISIGCQRESDQLQDAWQQWSDAGLPRSLQERAPLGDPDLEDAWVVWERTVELLSERTRRDALRVPVEEMDASERQHLAEAMSEFAEAAAAACKQPFVSWDRTVYQSSFPFDHLMEWISPARESARLLIRYAEMLHHLDRTDEARQAVLSALTLSRRIGEASFFVPLRIMIELDDQIFDLLETFERPGDAEWNDHVAAELTARSYYAILRECVVRDTLIVSHLFRNRSVDEVLELAGGNLASIRQSVPRYSSIRDCDHAEFLLHQLALLRRMDEAPGLPLKVSDGDDWPDCALLAQEFSSERAVVRISESSTPVAARRRAILQSMGRERGTGP